MPGVNARRGGSSARWVEDVAYWVIAVQQKPDHARIARFGVCHEDALAELFGAVLGLCRQAGLVKVGVIAIDGRKVHADASHHSNLDYEQWALQDSPRTCVPIVGTHRTKESRAWSITTQATPGLYELQIVLDLSGSVTKHRRGPPSRIE
jgi:hypothetical protein